MAKMKIQICRFSWFLWCLLCWPGSMSGQNIKSMNVHLSACICACEYVCAHLFDLWNATKWMNLANSLQAHSPYLSIRYTSQQHVWYPIIFFSSSNTKFTVQIFACSAFIVQKWKRNKNRSTVNQSESARERAIQNLQANVCARERVNECWVSHPWRWVCGEGSINICRIKEKFQHQIRMAIVMCGSSAQ